MARAYVSLDLISLGVATLMFSWLSIGLEKGVKVPLLALVMVPIRSSLLGFIKDLF